MEKNELEKLLNAVSSGEIPVQDAMEEIQKTSLADVDLGYAKPDFQRGVRQGVSEVIYGSGKTPEQIAGIVQSMREHGQSRILITRIDQEKSDSVQGILREDDKKDYRYYADSRIAIEGGIPDPKRSTHITVACAGTSDLPVAEEAALTAEFLGTKVERCYDVGVAGIHRLFAHLDKLESASCVVCVAGMEGALASVVGGLVACPVIAVPTSIGYGTALHGVAALLSMLNSCASGVSVVNIDNGFGAGYQATLIDRGPQWLRESSSLDRDRAY